MEEPRPLPTTLGWPVSPSNMMLINEGFGEECVIKFTHFSRVEELVDTTHIRRHPYLQSYFHTSPTTRPFVFVGLLQA